MVSNDIVGDREIAEKVLLNNALNHLGGGMAIPNAVGVHHQDGAVLAYPQAIGFGAEKVGGWESVFRAILRAGFIKPKLLKASF